MSTLRTQLLASLAALFFSTLLGSNAFAQQVPEGGYAEPPPHHDPDDPPHPPQPSIWAHNDPRDDSLVRLNIGSVARINADSIRPGLFAAMDFGRGPAGFRISGTWVRVGYKDPLSQYTGELTLQLPFRSAFRPTFGVGAGLARTYQVDENGQQTSGGANLGVGTIRAGVEYRIPLRDTDVRAGLGATATFPAIKASDAPSLDPWVLLGAAVSIGF